MAETVQVKNVNQAAILDKVDELLLVAVILEGSKDRIVFPSPLQDRNGSIWAALIAILEGEDVALTDLGKLLHHIANTLDNVDNYR